MGKNECHHHRDNSWWLLSPTGVRITLVCKECKDAKAKAFNIRTMYRARTDEITPEFGHADHD